MHQISSNPCKCEYVLGGGEQDSWNNTPLKDKDLQHDGLDVWFDKAGSREMDMFQWN